MQYIAIDMWGKVEKGAAFCGVVVGTCLKGYVHTSYAQLIETFGQPTSFENGSKIDVEWVVFTPNGPATIYNYKDGIAYLGAEGLPVEQITEWHVGAFCHQPYLWIKKVLGQIEPTDIMDDGHE